jgi:hypothetical protein
VTTITPERAVPPEAPEPGDDAPVPVSGILDVAENQAFLRTSGYRLGRDDLLMSREELAAVDSPRRALAGLDPQQALELLLDSTRDTTSNLEFLVHVRRTARPSAGR